MLSKTRRPRSSIPLPKLSRGLSSWEPPRETIPQLIVGFNHPNNSNNQHQAAMNFSLSFQKMESIYEIWSLKTVSFLPMRVLVCEKRLSWESINFFTLMLAANVDASIVPLGCLLKQEVARRLENTWHKRKLVLTLKLSTLLRKALWRITHEVIRHGRKWKLPHKQTDSLKKRENYHHIFFFKWFWIWKHLWLKSAGPF